LAIHWCSCWGGTRINTLACGLTTEPHSGTLEPLGDTLGTSLGDALGRNARLALGSALVDALGPVAATSSVHQWAVSSDTLGKALGILGIFTGTSAVQYSEVSGHH
jgi:hypothetical protein